MNTLLKGELALVTGAGQGNGEAIAIGLAAHGARVVATDLDPETAARTAGQIRDQGGEAWSYELDVSDAEACQACTATVAAEAGRVSVLVNNAGVFHREPVTAPTVPEHWRHTMAVNLDGVFNVSMAFLDALIETKGRIINLGSVSSYFGSRNAVAYATSKAGVMNLTKAMASDLGVHGVRVNGIAPGAIETAMTEEQLNDPVERAKADDRIVLGRIAQPEELVGPVVFLASEMSGYVTGVMLPVDGGFLTR